MAAASTELLKQNISDFITECRKSISEGKANLSGLEHRVRDYCIAIARTSEEERRAHAADLQELMVEVEALESELLEARENIRNELAGLSRLKHASVAYHKSDAIGPIHRPKNEDDE